MPRNLSKTSLKRKWPSNKWRSGPKVAVCARTQEHTLEHEKFPQAPDELTPCLRLLSAPGIGAAHYPASQKGPELRRPETNRLYFQFPHQGASENQMLLKNGRQDFHLNSNLTDFKKLNDRHQEQENSWEDIGTGIQEALHELWKFAWALIHRMAGLIGSKTQQEPLQTQLPRKCAHRLPTRKLEQVGRGKKSEKEFSKDLSWIWI